MGSLNTKKHDETIAATLNVRYCGNYLSFSDHQTTSHMKSITLTGILLLFICGIVAANDADSTAKQKKRLFELSFGQSKLFISNSKEIDLKENHAVIMPTNAILFFAEFRPQKKLKVPVFFNLATQPKQFLVDSVLVSERASPTFGTGLVFRAFRFGFGEKSALEFESGPLASVLIDRGGKMRFAPVIAGRFRFLKNEDFIMYIGSSYSVGINAFGLFYGTGYVF